MALAVLAGFQPQWWLKSSAPTNSHWSLCLTEQHGIKSKWSELIIWNRCYGIAAAQSNPGISPTNCFLRSSTKWSKATITETVCSTWGKKEKVWGCLAELLLQSKGWCYHFGQRSFTTRNIKLSMPWVSLSCIWGQRAAVQRAIQPSPVSNIN